MEDVFGADGDSSGGYDSGQAEAERMREQAEADFARASQEQQDQLQQSFEDLMEDPTGTRTLASTVEPSPFDPGSYNDLIDGTQPEVTDVSAQAAALVDENSRKRGGHAGRNNPDPIVDTENIARELAELGRQAPAEMASVRAALDDTLTPDQIESLDTNLQEIQGYEVQAFKNLAGDLEGRVEVDSALAESTAQGLLDDTTRTRSTGRGQNSTEYVDTNELAYQLTELAVDDPALAVAAKLSIDGKLSAFENAELNRLIGGGASWTENVSLAVQHPGEIEGLFEGMVNGVVEVGEMFARGAAMQQAGSQYQAAGLNALVGQTETADRMMQSADALMAAAPEIELPKFTLENRAQQGWATVGAGVDLAFAGYGLVKGGVRVLSNADEIVEVVVKSGDNVPVSSADVVDDGLDVVLSTADDVPTRAPELRDFDIEIEDPRIKELSIDSAIGGKPRLNEGIGGHRLEQQLGYPVTRSTDSAVDFVDTTGQLGNIDLKGPLVTNDGTFVVNDKTVEGLGRSVVTEVNLSTASDTVVVDTLGLTDNQVRSLKETIEAGVNADHGKNIIILE